MFQSINQAEFYAFVRNDRLQTFREVLRNALLDLKAKVGETGFARAVMK